MQRGMIGTISLLLCVDAACYYRQSPIRVAGRDGFESVFNGFVYIGKDVDRDSHNSAGNTFPNSLLVGHKYVLHHERPFDGVQFARDILPSRLRGMGLTVTKSVDSGQGPYVVEPVTVWSVSFRRGSCSGIIYTDVCRDLTRRHLFRNPLQYEEEDYYIQLQGDCSGILANSQR